MRGGGEGGRRTVGPSEFHESYTTSPSEILPRDPVRGREGYFSVHREEFGRLPRYQLLDWLALVAIETPREQALGLVVKRRPWLSGIAPARWRRGTGAPHELRSHQVPSKFGVWRPQELAAVGCGSASGGSRCRVNAQ